MKPSTNPLGRVTTLLALVVGLTLAATACTAADEADDALDPETAEVGSDEDADEAQDEAQDVTDGEQDTAEADGFPVNVETSSGTVEIPAAPTSIVSLSPTATEILFAIGAGDRVVAVDLFSNYPAEAPEGTLDGFAPDLEAILATSPDLVVTSGLPEDVTAGLTANDIPVIFQPAASSFDDTYDQVAQLGEATGEIDLSLIHI